MKIKASLLAVLLFMSAPAWSYTVVISPLQFLIGNQPFTVDYGYVGGTLTNGNWVGVDGVFAYASAWDLGNATQYTQSQSFVIVPDNGDLSIKVPITVAFRVQHSKGGATTQAGGCSSFRQWDIPAGMTSIYFEKCALSDPFDQSIALFTNTRYRVETNAQVRSNGVGGENRTEITWTLPDEAPPDADADGIADSADNCSEVANPDQTDIDHDGVGDACDVDDDGDGLGDDMDNCPSSVAAGSNQTDTDGDGAGNLCDADLDGDSVANANDVCPLDPDPFQTDSDGDGLGDACDADDDNDAVCDIEQTLSGVCGGGPDNCSLTPNFDQTDLDSDAIGDPCDADLDGDGAGNGDDNCPLLANNQTDSDADGQGDECDADDDNDGIADGSDNCPIVVNADQIDADHDQVGDACNEANDQDGDDWSDSLDNCPTVANGNQIDSDADGIGDGCDPDDDNDGVTDATDLCPASLSGVVDPSSGCSAMQSCPCAGPRGTTEQWRNHGAYTSCVAHVTSTLVEVGLLSVSERSTLVSSAAQSNCGKK